MKKFITLLFLVFSINFSAQSLDFHDLGILFSQNDHNGTARFMAMGGAFGALGGDVSSIHNNPAGLTVFNNSVFSGSLQLRDTETLSNYYGSSTLTNNQFFNLSQAGTVLVFDTSSFNSDWNKFAVGFNYRITNDFDNRFTARGNSNIATFVDYPLDINDPPLLYNIADEQRFTNDFRGEMTELNVAFSALYSNEFHLGIGFNFYDINFEQQNNLTEFNSDTNGNELDANLYQENFLTGTGFSANLGILYTPNGIFRFGLSYQTPTWYNEVFDQNNIVNNDGYFGDTEIVVSNDNLIYDNTAGGNFPFQEVIYSLRTPGQFTTSAAVVFGKVGLISVDYEFKNYTNIRVSGNNIFNTIGTQNPLNNTSNLRIGTEWRFDRISLRAGYRFEESPFKNNFFNDTSIINLDDLTGYSFGGGYAFGRYKIDFSYSNTNRNSLYNFYQGFAVNSANLTMDNRIFTATLSLSL